MNTGPSASRLTASIIPVTTVSTTNSTSNGGGSNGCALTSMTPDSDMPPGYPGADMPEGLWSEE